MRHQLLCFLFLKSYGVPEKKNFLLVIYQVAKLFYHHLEILQSECTMTEVFRYLGILFICQHNYNNYLKMPKKKKKKNVGRDGEEA